MSYWKDQLTWSEEMEKAILKHQAERECYAQQMGRPERCPHDPVNVGFTSRKLVCRLCDEELADD